MNDQWNLTSWFGRVLAPLNGPLRRLFLAQCALICICATDAARGSNERRMASQIQPDLNGILVADNNDNQGTGSANQPAPTTQAPAKPLPAVPQCSAKAMVPNSQCPSGFAWKQQCDGNTVVVCATQVSQ